MALSSLVNENEEYIKDAINEGINADAVNSTLEDVVNRADEIGKTPKQVKETVEIIVDMKSDVEESNSVEFASDFVNKNSEKIKSAINDGISPNEVANTLVNSTNEATNKKGKKHLNFIVKLISKMKKKELNLKNNKQQEKGRQKVLK